MTETETKTEEKPVELRMWQLPDGKPKPEWTIKFPMALADGRKTITLSEPTMRARKKSYAVMVRDANGYLTRASEMAAAEQLVMTMGNLTEDDIDNLTGRMFDEMIGYLTSFLSLPLKI